MGRFVLGRGERFIHLFASVRFGFFVGAMKVGGAGFRLRSAAGHRLQAQFGGTSGFPKPERCNWRCAPRSSARATASFRLSRQVSDENALRRDFLSATHLRGFLCWPANDICMIARRLVGLHVEILLTSGAG